MQPAEGPLDSRGRAAARAPARARALRLVNGVLATLFLFGAVVQYNDPDPLRWIAIYLAAAVACLVAARRPRHWQTPAVVAAIALAWSVSLAAAVVGDVRLPELFGDWEMEDPRVEVGREMYGLLIIAAWMVVLAVIAVRRGRAARPDRSPAALDAGRR